jgi:acetyl esterase/lipase
MATKGMYSLRMTEGRLLVIELRGIGSWILTLVLRQRLLYTICTAGDSRWVQGLTTVLMVGSTAFYQEFLMNVIRAIPDHSARIFSLDYSLVPESRYPEQLQQVARGYEYLLSTTSADNIVVGGDSAGASLLLSLLLHIIRPCPDLEPASRPLRTPASIVLISPWCRVDSGHSWTSRPTTVVDEDFLDTEMLDSYARLYTGTSTPQTSLSVLFPVQFYIAAFKGLCVQLQHPPYTVKWITLAKLNVLESTRDPDDSQKHTALCASPYLNPFAALQHPEWLADALPMSTLIVFGGKEMMAGDIIEFAQGVKKVSKGNVEVRSRWRLGWHAWPMALMYLGRDTEETESGVKLIAQFVTRVMSIRSIA